MQAIQLKKDDVVIMPSVNFIASYNVAKILGAKIYLADVNKTTGQMSPKNVEDCCKKFNLKKINNQKKEFSLLNFFILISYSFQALLHVAQPKIIGCLAK